MKFNCEILEDDLDKLNNCERVKLWEISSDSYVFLSLEDTIGNDRTDKQIFSPIVLFFSFIASLYGVIGYQVTRKYNSKN